MSDEPITTITPDKRLQVFGLLIVAGQQYGQCRKLERAALEVLGRNEDRFLNDHLGDLLYQTDEDGSFTEGEFDEALKLSGYAVAPHPIAPLLNEASGIAASLEAAEGKDPIFNDAAAMIKRLAGMIEKYSVPAS